MTRVERLAQQEARAKEKLREDRQKHAQVQSKRREEEKRQRTKRYFLAGKMADAAGLLTLSDTDLAGLFRLLGPLTQGPDLVAVLESLLCDAPRPALVLVDGCADLRSCGPSGASVDTVQ
jgi:hypothetical protein